MILFEHGYSLDKVHFFKNIRCSLLNSIAIPVLTAGGSTITIFAVFGTVIAAAFCAFGIYFLGQVCDPSCIRSPPASGSSFPLTVTHIVQWGLVHPLSPLYSAIFGAVMSAVQFQQLHHHAFGLILSAPPRLILSPHSPFLR